LYLDDALVAPPACARSDAIDPKDKTANAAVKVMRPLRIVCSPFGLEQISMLRVWGLSPSRQYDPIFPMRNNQSQGAHKISKANFQIKNCSFLDDPS